MYYTGQIFEPELVELESDHVPMDVVAGGSGGRSRVYSVAQHCSIASDG